MRILADAQVAYFANHPCLHNAQHSFINDMDSFHSDSAPPPPPEAGHDDGNEDWAALLSQDLWDYEAGFWQSLADHPSLLAIDPPLPNV